MITVGSPAEIEAPQAAMSPVRAAGRPSISTEVLPFMIAVGG
jgi:hypothetical protein